MIMNFKHGGLSIRHVDLDTATNVMLQFPLAWNEFTSPTNPSCHPPSSPCIPLQLERDLDRLTADRVSTKRVCHCYYNLKLNYLSDLTRLRKIFQAVIYTYPRLASSTGDQHPMIL